VSKLDTSADPLDPNDVRLRPLIRALAEMLADSILRDHHAKAK
jgi:hypothetical protein